MNRRGNDAEQTDSRNRNGQQVQLDEKDRQFSAIQASEPEPSDEHQDASSAQEQSLIEDDDARQA
jgi:hypothetical protein